MGKNRSKNKRKQEKKTAQKEKEQEENLKLDIGDEKKEDTEYLNTDLVPSPGYEEGKRHNQDRVKKKSSCAELQTPKNHEKQIESMEVDDKPPTKNRRKGKHKNSHQDPDHKMECDEEDRSENSRGKRFVKENLNDEEEGHWEEVKKRKPHVKFDTLKNHDNQVESMEIDNKPATKNRQKSDQMNNRKMDCEEEGWVTNGPQRKNSKRERDQNHSSHQRNHSRNRDDHSRHRREDNSHHRYNNQNRKHNFNDRGSRNDSNYQNTDHRQKKEYHSRSGDVQHTYDSQKDTRNMNHRNHQRHYDDKYSGRGDNRRNDNTNYLYREKKQEQAYSRRHNEETENSFEKRGEPYGKRNFNQNGYYPQSRCSQEPQFNKQHENILEKCKKKNKQKLYVPNAVHYEPTIREIEGDLFESSEEYSLAHCVAEDLSMGAGIAVEFKKRFKGVQYLLKQEKRVGEVAILKNGARFIFYLITKRQSYGKPTIDSITTAIKSLKQICLELNVKKLAIPRIGCGLDRLDWGEVKNILYDEFSTTDIEIVVYVW